MTIPSQPSGWAEVRGHRPGVRPRFRVSIRSMMIFVLIVAVGLALTRPGYAFMLPLVAIGLLPASFCACLVRGHRRLAAYGLVAAWLVADVLIALICIHAVSIAGYLLMTLVSLGLVPVAAGCGLAWAIAATRPGAIRRRPSWLAWSLVAVACLMPLSMIADLWPLRLAFLHARPSLDAMADRVARGRPVVGPERAGCFEVVASTYDPATGDVALVTNPNPAGRSGFLRLGFRDGTRQAHLFTNLDFDERMNGRWRYQDED